MHRVHPPGAQRRTGAVTADDPGGSAIAEGLPPVLFEDRDIIAIDKPSGLASVPGRGIDKLDSALARLMRSHPTALAVHRLDVATSGVLVFALRRSAERSLRRQFVDRSVAKTYLARVAGRPAAEGSIDLPLAADPARAPLQHVSPSGKVARTLWVLLEGGETSSLVQLTPQTGRSHQLRVHLAAIGHPILGDIWYAPTAIAEMSPRLLLHASEITFLHPYSGRKVTIRSEGGF